MATVFLGSFADDTIRFEADFNDGNKRITTVRCINASGSNARVTLIDPADDTIVAQVTMPGGTTQYNVAGQAVTVEEDGEVIVPYIVRLDFPVP